MDEPVRHITVDTLHQVARCGRCRRRPTAEQWTREAWNVTMADGVIIGFLCPDCQTAEENAEAEINEATLDYEHSGFDEGGRWSVPPKGADT